MKNVLMFLLIITILLTAGCSSKNSLEHAHDISELNDIIQSQSSLIEELELLNQSIQSRLNEYESRNDELQVNNDNSLLNDNSNDYFDKIKHDLMKQLDLIPLKGVLGGTPQYYEENIFITHNYAFAVAEDGHVCVYMLLTYDIDEYGVIDWKVAAYDIGGSYLQIVSDAN